MTTNRLKENYHSGGCDLLCSSPFQLIENLHAYVKNLLDAKQLPDIEVNTDEILLWVSYQLICIPKAWYEGTQHAAVIHMHYRCCL